MTVFSETNDLPINDVLSALKDALCARDEVVLQAPPGAGKTTLVPLALLSEPYLKNQKILMLEPRRLAARAAAERMANLLGESVGQTVGYRVRLDSKVSRHTRIEVITEGILTRMLQDDPSLEGVGLVIFDEFHERSVDADLGLALALHGRSMFRDSADGATALKILVMSATLDDLGIAALIGGASAASTPAPVIQSEGRQFPVSVHYGAPAKIGEKFFPSLANRVVDTVLEAMASQHGSVLVFLPGQSEIRTVAKILADKLAASASNGYGDDEIDLAPLFGNLSITDQRRAIAASPQGRRKVVLATAIAESSLTIDGIRVVVDAGLSREPMFDPNTGMTRLHTRSVSRASSIQRAGRAGRLEEGHCYRCWSELQQSQLRPFTEPEILQADLAPLVLQLLCWGVGDLTELDWLDPPPAASFQQALELLQRLGALSLDASGAFRVTPHGQAMARFPAHPRIAHLLMMSKTIDAERVACQLAAILSDRDPLSRDEVSKLGADLAYRTVLFEETSKRGSSIATLQKHSQQFERLLTQFNDSKAEDALGLNEDAVPGFLLACAYPDRVALRRRANSEEYQLANGRTVHLKAGDPLQKCDWLVCAHLGGSAGNKKDTVYLAVEFRPELLDSVLKHMTHELLVAEWDEQTGRFVAETQRKVGALVYQSKTAKDLPASKKQAVLLGVVRARGLSILPWTADIQAWRARVILMHALSANLCSQGGCSHEPSQGPWPDLSDEGLLSSLEEWLGPYLDRVSHIKHFSNLDLAAILKAMLPWPLPKQLDDFLPERIEVPSGSKIRIDYAQQPPVLAVRLQEMLGAASTPKVAKNTLPLMLHLLTPAQRPLAVTQDLESFWRNAYPDVKKEMKGRYPKHFWPDNPLEAEPTARAKPRNR